MLYDITARHPAVRVAVRQREKSFLLFSLVNKRVTVIKK